jgi:acyl-CoA reductase-like NAD-dependent aldehyde dehydrogenase
VHRSLSMQYSVVANVTRDMRIAKEEIFGPVLSILTYKTEAEVIATFCRLPFSPPRAAG